MDPRNYVSHAAEIPHGKRNVWGVYVPLKNIVKYWIFLEGAGHGMGNRVSSAKTAEPTDMAFGSRLMCISAS